MNVQVLSEDTYGKQFISNLVSVLKSASVIDNGIKISTLKYNLYKLRSIITASIRSFNKVIVLIDCDGDCQSGNSALAIREIEKFNYNNIIQIRLSWEIEDWLCISEGISINSERSSIALRKKYNGYRKFQLPKYAQKLDVEKLSKESESFSKFLNELR